MHENCKKINEKYAVGGEIWHEWDIYIAYKLALEAKIEEKKFLKFYITMTL